MQLHRNEGARANILAFTSWIAFVKFLMSKKWWAIVNQLHVYTAGRELELPRDATLGDILAGTYGKMDKENPLRVIWIPGKSGDYEKEFPSLSWLCGGKRREVMNLPASETLSIAAEDQDDRLPNYEEATNC